MIKKIVSIFLSVLMLLSVAVVASAQLEALTIQALEGVRVDTTQPGDSNLVTSGTWLAKDGSRWAFMKFDISEIAEALIYNTDYVIDKAYVSLVCVGDWKEGIAVSSPVNPQLYYVADDTWAETEITLNNQPSVGDIITDDSVTVPQGTTNYPFTLDITGAVKTEVSKTGDSFISLCLKNKRPQGVSANAGTVYAGTRYTNAEYRPKLTIIFKEKTYYDAIDSVEIYDQNGVSSTLPSGNVTVIANMVSWEDANKTATLFGGLYKKDSSGNETMVDLKTTLPVEVTRQAPAQGILEFNVPSDDDYFVRIWVTDGIDSQRVYSSERLIDANGVTVKYDATLSKFSFADEEAQVNRQTGIIKLSAKAENAKKNFGVIVLKDGVTIQELTPVNISQNVIYASCGQAENGEIAFSFALVDKSVIYENYTAIIDNMDSIGGAVEIPVVYYLDSLADTVFGLMKNAQSSGELKTIVEQYSSLIGLDTESGVDLDLLCEKLHPVTEATLGDFTDEYNTIVATEKLNSVTQEDALASFESLIDNIKIDEELKDAVKSDKFPQYAKDSIAEMISESEFSYTNLVDKTEKIILTSLITKAPKYADLMKALEDSELLADYFSEAFAGSKYDKISKKEKFYKELISLNLDGKENIEESIVNAANTVYDAENEKPKSSGGGGGGRVTGAVSVSNPAIKTPPPITEEQIKQAEEKANQDLNFSDVPLNSWMYGYIKELLDKKIIGGYEDNTFKPDDFISREEFTKLIVLAAKIKDAEQMCDFSDVGEGRWSNKYISAAVNAGIVNGISEDNFAPLSNITREDAVVICARALGDEIKFGEGKAFADETMISEYAKGAMEKLSSIGILNGDSDGNVRPKHSLTRAEACALVCKLLAKLVR